MIKFDLKASLSKIGVIAGNGIYPETFINEARNFGVGFICTAGFKYETKPEVKEISDSFKLFRVGELSKMIKYFISLEIKEVVMVGQIAPKNLFDFRPDIRIIKMLSKLKEKNAESIFSAIANEMKLDGITTLPAITFLDNYLAKEGHIYGPKISEDQESDIEFGFKIAKKISELDIGQSVVVKNGTVLAVEAFEGTNETIKRGGLMGKGKSMLVKVSKPNQDWRFDVPVIGDQTIVTAKEFKVNVIVIEEGSTLILAKEEIEKQCKKNKISLIGYKKHQHNK